jgi:hypothetical protein
MCFPYQTFTSQKQLQITAKKLVFFFFVCQKTNKFGWYFETRAEFFINFYPFSLPTIYFSTLFFFCFFENLGAESPEKKNLGQKDAQGKVLGKRAQIADLFVWLVPFPKKI